MYKQSCQPICNRRTIYHMYTTKANRKIVLHSCKDQMNCRRLKGLKREQLGQFYKHNCSCIFILWPGRAVANCICNTQHPNYLLTKSPSLTKSPPPAFLQAPFYICVHIDRYINVHSNVHTHPHITLSSFILNFPEKIPSI